MHVESIQKSPFNPRMLVVVLTLHLACLSAPWLATPGAVLCFALTTPCTILGITLGYHRLLTHRSFACQMWLERLLSLWGSLSLQGGPNTWVAVHRQHHKHSDHELDPHNSRRGLWWSHMGWIFHLLPHRMEAGFRQRMCPELEKDWFHWGLDRSYLLWNVLFGTLLWAWGGLPWLVWGGCLRIVACFHMVGAINSLCHGHGRGYRNFDTRDQSVNVPWVAWLSAGEGYHNNHHAFPWSARLGLKKGEFDPAWMVLRAWERLGWVSDLKQP